MTDRARLRATRPATPEDGRLLTRLPPDIVRRLNRILDEHEGQHGVGRTIELQLHLDDETGLITPIGTWVRPPRECAAIEKCS
jgi:hypothetical protein